MSAATVLFLTCSGSVDILATTMRIRNRKFIRIGVCYGRRRCDGRSWTPALCPHRSASLSGGASALPKPLQQTPIYAAAVAGHSLLDALRRLDLREAEMRRAFPQRTYRRRALIGQGREQCDGEEKVVTKSSIVLEGEWNELKIARQRRESGALSGALWRD